MPTDPRLPSRLIVIGRREYVTFPEWGWTRLRAKIDTGAYSSALDVQGYEMEGDERTGRTAHLRLVLNRRKARQVSVVKVPVLRVVRVTSSSGTKEYRPLIEVPMRLGGVVRPIRLTVTNRASMRCRMLLGRQALAGVFLVDVSRKYVLPD